MRLLSCLIRVHSGSYWPLPGIICMCVKSDYEGFYTFNLRVWTWLCRKRQTRWRFLLLKDSSDSDMADIDARQKPLKQHRLSDCRLDCWWRGSSENCVGNYPWRFSNWLGKVNNNSWCFSSLRYIWHIVCLRWTTRWFVTHIYCEISTAMKLVNTSTTSCSILCI